MSVSLLEVESLGWNVDQKDILRDISFGIAEGEFVGLIGPNGAGKSSLMRCLYRVNRPTAGRVLLKGADIWRQSAKESAKRTAVILQEAGDHFGLTVREIVALGLTPHKRLFERDTWEEKVRIKEILQQNDLYALRYQRFSQLSGGEKQRVMLARAIVQQPEFLIMDEPTNHLDIHYQISVLRKVKTLGVTVLASFHDLNLAAAFCDRLLVMEQGRLIAQGTPQAVMNEDLLGSIFATCAIVDKHPLHGNPRISYAYHE